MEMNEFEEEVSEEFRPLAEVIKTGFEDAGDYLDLEPDEEVSIVTRSGKRFYAKDCRLYVIPVPNEIVNEATENE